MKRPYTLPRGFLGAAPSTIRWLSTICIALAFLASPVRAQDPIFIKVTGQPIVDDVEPSLIGIWCDFNHDGFMDLFVGNSQNGSPVSTNSLYRNQGDGTFTRIINSLTSTALNTWGGCWGDYDNDGHPDLVIVPFGGAGARLYRGDGGGGFTYVQSADFSGVSQVDAAWGDLDRDGWLDLVICNREGLKDLALRNLGDGRFQRLTAGEVGALVEDAATTGSPSFADFDNDGDPDLYVSCESGYGFLYRNNGKGFFEKVAPGSLSTSANFATVGGVWADFDNDGYFDLLTTTRSTAPRLHRNVEGLTFQDVTAAAGLLMAPGNVWGPAWGDFDNDGDLDLFVPYYDATNMFFLNNGDGTFTSVDVGSPLREGYRDECASWMDYDNDGFLDLFVACGEANPNPNLLYRNNLPASGNANHWLKVRLTGTVSSHLAIGAKIRVRAVIQGRETWQLRQVASNGAFASGAELIAHFGLGDATAAERVIIEWPSGNVTELTDQAANQTLSIRETVGITPTRPSASLNGSVTLSIRGPKLQWQFEGVDLAGQTNRNLVLTNLTAEQAGRYSVLVDNGTTVVTNFTHLTVDPTFTKITEGSPVTDLGCSWRAAWGDYDGDDHPDLLVLRYLSGINALHHNQGDGTFHAVPHPPFPQTSGAWVSGAFADLDNNGATDLIVAGWNQPLHLSFNERDGTFMTSTLPGISMFWSLSVVDYDRDGHLDIFLTGESSSSTLFRGLGDRSFTRMTAQAVGPLLTSSQFGNSAWADYDDDGWPEVYTANLHANRNDLFKNDGTGKFTRVDNLVTRTAEPAIVGAWGDFDNDGDLDLCVACFSASSSVYRNLGNGEFERANLGLALGAGNSASWADYDNDGWLDLYMTWPRALYRNNGDGTFTRVLIGSPVNEIPPAGGDSYIGMWFDYDNDGFLDLHAVNGNDGGTANIANFLYRNNGNDNGWLKVKLMGTTSNRDGIGAKVRMLPLGRGQVWQRRDITGGDAFNGNQLYAHFGLGSAISVKTLRIEWPSGMVQELQNIPAKQTITVIEPHLQGAFDDAGAFRIAVTCDTHRSYGLEVSTDLVEWTNVVDFTDGSGVYTEDAPPTQRRFYRLR